jgi:hypothetical protein
MPMGRTVRTGGILPEHIHIPVQSGGLCTMPVNVQLRIRLLRDSHVAFEFSIGAAAPLVPFPNQAQLQEVVQPEYRVLPLGTSVLSPGLAAPLPG